MGLESRSVLNRLLTVRENNLPFDTSSYSPCPTGFSAHPEIPMRTAAPIAYYEGMSTQPLVSVAEYLSTSFRPDRDYLDGVIVERAVGERDHSRLQMLLSAYLFQREGSLGIDVVPEQRVQVKPDRFRIPDICVLAHGTPPAPIYTEPPFLCVEILSKDDAMSSMLERIHDYLEFGVAYVWVVDPRTHRAWTYTRNEIREVTDGMLRTQNPDITVPFVEIFKP